MIELLQKLAVGVARYYANPRRCWWADREELQQEALTAMLGAIPHFDPRVGVALEDYLRRVARNEALAWLRSNGGPTSGGESWEFGVELPSDSPRSDRSGGPRALGRSMLDPRARQDEQLHDAAWAADAAREVRAVVHASGGELAVAVLLGEESPADVARAHEVEPREVYSAAARARAAVGRSYDLWELMRAR